MRYNDAYHHIKGETLFLDDITVPEGTLHAYVLTSTIAHGEIEELNISKAKAAKGVAAIFISSDIPGENQIGSIIEDEPLLAEKDIHFHGQAVAVVIAVTRKDAEKASKLIHVKYKEKKAITDPREAYEKGLLIAPPRTFSLGDTENALESCDIVVSGTVESGGQEHLYLETQGALAIPIERGNIKIVSSTQSPTGVQKAVAKVLGVPMHYVEVDTPRLGGGFGGKEDQATPWAAISAVTATLLKTPVKLVLSREEDLAVTGKRHPYSSDFTIGLDKSGKIIAYEATFYQNGGAAADLSTAILERTLFHSTNSYFIPNVKATAVSCRTNLPPFTAFRGFGAPQAMFVLESAIYQASEKLGMHPSSIQKMNLIKEGDLFPYGMQAENVKMEECWSETEETFGIKEAEKKAESFNKVNSEKKKGTAVMPLCFGISFTNTMLNQAGALIHLYNDGSIRVSTGAVEMGQGVNMKIRLIVADTFSISPDRVIVDTTNTGRVANTSPTAASTGADMNGKAAELAAEAVLERLIKSASEILEHQNIDEIELKDEKIFVNGKESGLNFEKLVLESYIKRVNLSAQAFYATPDIYFDKKREKGKPFAYHVFGAALIESTLDCVRGTFEIDSVKIIHDAGKSIDKIIDMGQVEGGLIQGMGWVTMEELKYNSDGKSIRNN